MITNSFINKNGLKTFRFEINEDEFHELDHDYSGLCLSCSEIAYNVEPDARKYKCESCEALRVYGLQELLVMGYITISVDE